MVSRERQLAVTFIQLADTLVSDYDLLSLLDVLLERSMAIVDANAGGVLLSDGKGSLKPLVCSDETMRMLELFELQNDEGPCIESYRRNEQIVQDDMARSARWPRFTPVALENGYRSALAIPMRLRGDVIGAVNLFRDRPGQVERADVDAAQAFADIATIGILQQRAVSDARQLTGQLQTALNSRIVLEQAKGIVAERAQMDIGDAYQALRWYARNHNRYLRDVAAEVVSGALDASEVARTRIPPVRGGVPS
jgi:GAF domain-containing protein